MEELTMKLVWQVNEEWWGHRCVARSGDYCASISEMDNRCFWSIREDQKVVAKGVNRGPYHVAQKLVASQFRRITFRNLFRRKSVG